VRIFGASRSTEDEEVGYNHGRVETPVAPQGAEDGIQGLGFFEASKETIDLVFTDIVLPRGNGFDVAA
jgi:DNA-binding LytR/AlgR family response regulator